MINTLFLDAGEIRTVNANKYNVVAKSLFPCSIRVLDKFGVESDRFDDVTSGFSFCMPECGLYKLEITNGIYGQDVKIYSGVFEVKNVNKFTHTYSTLLYVGGTASNYSYFHLKNYSKKSLIICIEDMGNKQISIDYTDNGVIGTELITNHSIDVLSNDNLLIPIIEGYTNSYSSYKFARQIFRGDYGNNHTFFKVPAQRGFFYINGSVATELKSSFKIQM